MTGSRGTFTGRFVLDTGAAATTMAHERAELIGYSPRDGFRRTKVHKLGDGAVVCNDVLTDDSEGM